MYLRILCLAGLLAMAASAPAFTQNKPVEVALEVNTVQILLNDGHPNGVDWGAIVSDFHTEPLKREDNENLDGRKCRLTFGTLSEDDYAVLLDALDTVGRMRQYPPMSQKLAAGKAARISMEKQNILVDLLLTPLQSGGVSLHLEPHARLSVGGARDGSKAPDPLWLKTQTDMIVGNNTTIVIGGLMKEEEITTQHKFPLLGDIRLLGDIPFVGYVFRHQGHLMQKMETIVFLTVRSREAAD